MIIERSMIIKELKFCIVSSDKIYMGKRKHRGGSNEKK